MAPGCLVPEILLQDLLPKPSFQFLSISPCSTNTQFQLPALEELGMCRKHLVLQMMRLKSSRTLLPVIFLEGWGIPADSAALGREPRPALRPCTWEQLLKGVLESWSIQTWKGPTRIPALHRTSQKSRKSGFHGEAVEMRVWGRMDAFSDRDTAGLMHCWNC